MKSPLIALVIALSSALTMTHVVAQETATASSTPAALALQKIDVKVGSGKEALNGSKVTVHYSGFLYAPKASQQHGAGFDSSIGRAPLASHLAQVWSLRAGTKASPE